MKDFVIKEKCIIVREWHVPAKNKKEAREKFNMKTVDVDYLNDDQESVRIISIEEWVD